MFMHAALNFYSQEKRKIKEWSDVGLKKNAKRE